MSYNHEQNRPYDYSSLPDTGNWIRLIRLMPDQDEHAPLRCHLLNYHLQDSGKGAHRYEALSYVWGSPENRRVVFMPNGYIHVTTNLFAALTRLRDRFLERIIWVDAICINQDDKVEQGRQVQSMAMIFACANSVLVWLEETMVVESKETMTDGDRALEVISQAASGQPAEGKLSDTDREAVFSLTQRSWFRRIWVLQEVAAARHVLVICRTTEIDGHAFSVGLEALNIYPKVSDPNPAFNTQSSIRSTISLISNAILRPRRATSSSDKFSLNIRCLAELIDMYHNREATDLRDKVYALLGMATDVPPNITPDYNLPWNCVLHQVVESLVGKQATVKTWAGNEVAMIKATGHLIGKISLPGKDVLSRHQDNMSITEIMLSLEFTKDLSKLHNRESSIHLILPAAAKATQSGDLVYSLEGAPTPMIIRAHEDYCSVVAITLNPMSAIDFDGRDTVDWQRLIRRKRNIPHEILLLWDWNVSGGKPSDAVDDNYLSSSHISDDAKSELLSPLSIAEQAESFGILQYYAGQGRATKIVFEKLKQARVAYQTILGREHPRTLAVMDREGSIHRETRDESYGNIHETMADILQRRLDRTEEQLVHIFKYLGLEAITLLFDIAGEQVQITEKLMAVIVGNRKDGVKILRFLLGQRCDQVVITEKVLCTLADKINAREMMDILLDGKGDEVIITEEVLKCAAGNEYLMGKSVMELLLDKRGDQVIITEEILKAVAKNRWGAMDMMKLLLNKRGDQVIITEEILKAVLWNRWEALDMMKLLLNKRCDQVIITEELLKAIAANERGFKVLELLLDRGGASCYYYQGLAKGNCEDNKG